jgi:hypothetical protein
MLSARVTYRGGALPSDTWITSSSGFLLKHNRDLLNELKEVYAVFRVAIDYLLSLDVAEVILEDLLTQKVNERLNVFCHFTNVLTCCQLREINLRESSLEKLNVEFVTEKDSNIVDGLLHSQISQYVITQLNDDLHDYIILY